MKAADFIPRPNVEELRQALHTVRSFAGQPVENEEGYDPHVEHREYERLKEEIRRTRAELNELKVRERELKEALAANEERGLSAQRESSGVSWKRAVVLSEILAAPRSRRR